MPGQCAVLIILVGSITPQQVRDAIDGHASRLTDAGLFASFVVLVGQSLESTAPFTLGNVDHAVDIIVVSPALSQDTVCKLCVKDKAPQVIHIIGRTYKAVQPVMESVNAQVCDMGSNYIAPPAVCLSIHV